MIWHSVWQPTLCWGGGVGRVRFWRYGCKCWTPSPTRTRASSHAATRRKRLLGYLNYYEMFGTVLIYSSIKAGELSWHIEKWCKLTGTSMTASFYCATSRTGISFSLVTAYWDCQSFCRNILRISEVRLLSLLSWTVTVLRCRYCILFHVVALNAVTCSSLASVYQW